MCSKEVGYRRRCVRDDAIAQRSLERPVPALELFADRIRRIVALEQPGNEAIDEITVGFPGFCQIVDAGGDRHGSVRINAVP